MKFLGLNILTDRQLATIKAKEQFNYVLDVLKIKKLYRIYDTSEELPKCNKCNENREYEIILPDGQKVVKRCSCAKHLRVYKYHEVYRDDFNFIFIRTDGEVRLMEQKEYDDYRFHYLDKLDNLENPHHWGLYTSERKAKKAFKILNDKRIVY